MRQGGSGSCGCPGPGGAPGPGPWAAGSGLPRPHRPKRVRFGGVFQRWPGRRADKGQSPSRSPRGHRPEGCVGAAGRSALLPGPCAGSLGWRCRGLPAVPFPNGSFVQSSQSSSARLFPEGGAHESRSLLCSALLSSPLPRSAGGSSHRHSHGHRTPAIRCFCNNVG